MKHTKCISCGSKNIIKENNMYIGSGDVYTCFYCKNIFNEHCRPFWFTKWITNIRENIIYQFTKLSKKDS